MGLTDGVGETLTDLRGTVPVTVGGASETAGLRVVTLVLDVTIRETSEGLAVVVDVELVELGEVEGGEVGLVEVHLDRGNRGGVIDHDVVIADDVIAHLAGSALVLLGEVDGGVAVLEGEAESGTVLSVLELALVEGATLDVLTRLVLHCTEDIAGAEDLPGVLGDGLPLDVDLLGSGENDFFVLVGGDGQSLIDVGEDDGVLDVVVAGSDVDDPLSLDGAGGLDGVEDGFEGMFKGAVIGVVAVGSVDVEVLSGVDVLLFRALQNGIGLRALNSAILELEGVIDGLVVQVFGEEDLGELPGDGLDGTVDGGGGENGLS